MKALAYIFKILTLRLYFWLILNGQLVYFIQKLEILTILDQVSVVFSSL